MKIGERIREIRKQKGLTQKQAAEACEMKESNFRAYELGNANPKPETLKRIAEALEVPWLYLMGNDDLFADTVEGVIREYKDVKKQVKAAEGLKIILEAICGEYEERTLKGDWMEDIVPVYGKGEEAVVIHYEEFDALNDAVIGVVESLVLVLGKNAEEFIKDTQEWLSSEDAKEVRRQFDEERARRFGE